MKLKGSIKISGDKSISHRALIFASLSTGKVKISNLLESDDVMRTLNILKELGIKIFKKKIINIHPSLLPKYGGKGMYGDNVHNQVLLNNEKETGITIHYVNEKYDKGEVIFQKKINIQKDETLNTVKEKIKNLEMKYFPKIIYQQLP